MCSMILPVNNELVALVHLIAGIWIHYDLNYMEAAY